MISDDLKHDTATLYAFQKILHQHLDEHRIAVSVMKYRTNFTTNKILRKTPSYTSMPPLMEKGHVMVLGETLNVWQPVQA